MGKISWDNFVADCYHVQAREGRQQQLQYVYQKFRIPDFFCTPSHKLISANVTKIDLYVWVPLLSCLKEIAYASQPVRGKDEVGAVQSSYQYLFSGLNLD